MHLHRWGFLSGYVNGDKTFILQGIDPAVIGSFVEIKNPLGAQFGTYSDFLTAFETGLN
jgi:hypothetical protein